MDKKKMYLWVVLGLILALGIYSTSQRTKINTIKGGWDISQEVVVNGYGQYLVETSDFDYTSPEVYKIAQEIKQRTSTPREAIKETLTFVVQNTMYSSSVSVETCFEEKASTVLTSGVGDCVSMSRLVTALLRAQGIPTRTMGGCLSSTKRCAPIFAVIPLLEAKVTPMTRGDFKKRGFLHEWVKIWDGEKWLLGEATSGQLFDMECTEYGYLEFGYDTNPRDRCVITDSSFWNQCSVY